MLSATKLSVALRPDYLDHVLKKRPLYDADNTGNGSYAFKYHPSPGLRPPSPDGRGKYQETD